MKTQRSIYVLVTFMSIALAVLIAVQYLWLGSAIKIKGEEFDRNVLTAMRATAVAMEEKSTLKFLSQKLKNDSLAVKEIMEADSGFIRFVEEAADETTPEKQEIRTIVRINNEGKNKKVVIQTRTNGDASEEVTEMNYNLPVPPVPPLPPLPANERKEKLMSVMCQAADEYVVSTVDWKETLDSALLSKTIQKQFGKFQLPAEFAFAVFRSEDDSLLLSSSKEVKPAGFKYKTQLIGFDLSGKGLWLMVDFPERFKYVFASLAGMFILSLIFSAVIIVVFALALRLIFRQKKLNEITNDFINNMTHEFKTPLATISMTADTLQLHNVSGQNEQVKEYAESIKKETGKLSHYVDRILEAASQQKSKEQGGVTDLKQVLRRQVQLHETIFEQNNVKLQMQLPEEETLVFADEENLGYVISNLLDNAVKYSKEKPEITIDVEVKDHMILLTVQDRGIGIGKEDRKMIFEKFFRVHTGNRHDVKGFGLGLSFVKCTLESWGGRIYVESEPGEGSTFYAELKKA